MTRPARLIALLLAASALSACAAKDRLSYVGQPPPMSPMSGDHALKAIYGVPPHLVHDARRGGAQGAHVAGQHVSPSQMSALEAIAARRADTGNTNSLWRTNSTTFFGDPRASQVGDILTVNINIADRAQVNNQTARARQTSENSNLTNFLGGEAALGQFFNDSFDPSSLTSFGSTSSMRGNGSVNRSETISLTTAAIVVDVLWNGNMVITGRQEVRINNELRELLISGIVRPQDIASDNTIDHRQIAEARISYGGRGHISDMQRPPVGQEIYNILWPF
jgi:flagellar L-ring protein FlgH